MLILLLCNYISVFIFLDLSGLAIRHIVNGLFIGESTSLPIGKKAKRTIAK